MCKKRRKSRKRLSAAGITFSVAPQTIPHFLMSPSQGLLSQLVWSVHSRRHRPPVNLTASLEAQVRNSAERTLKHHQVSSVMDMNRNSQHSPSCLFLSTSPAMSSTSGTQAPSTCLYLHGLSLDLRA